MATSCVSSGSRRRAGFARLCAFGLILAFADCGGLPLPSLPDTTDCSTAKGQNTFVRDVLRDYYYWYKELPDPAVSGFDSPEAYLEAVRYRPLDTSFSYITAKAESDAFYSESQFIGLGFSMIQTTTTQIRVGQVFPSSPASEAGLLRGDELLSINGRAVADLIRTGEMGTILGPSEIGVTVTLAWRRPQGAQHEATLVKRLVTIPTVSDTTVLDADGARVGYVHFRNFVTPSTDALNTAFARMKADGARELILDLRYNGGGLLSVAQHLAGLIGGARTKGETFIQLAYNDKHTAMGSKLAFPEPGAALGVPRLLVVTTRSSASASEAVINGLRPFIPVVVVGDRTYGKPVGQSGFEFCEKVLFPVIFAVQNTKGEGDYFTGIPADCTAADDLDHALGSAAEASIAEAITFIRTGQCSARAAGTATAMAEWRRRTPPLRRDGWRQLINAE